MVVVDLLDVAVWRPAHLPWSDYLGVAALAKLLWFFTDAVDYVVARVVLVEREPVELGQDASLDDRLVLVELV